MSRLPDFLIIGAMKCATTTLHDQLALQAGVFMSTPKEPNFFGDDSRYAEGLESYARLFSAAGEGTVCGESSTHYAKRLEFPLASERIHQALPRVRIIYMMKHPVERLVSHYIHEWSQSGIDCSIDDALERHPELIDFSRYHHQLEPYLDRFGADAILPIFVPMLQLEPNAVLRQVAQHIGLHGDVAWRDEAASSNVSAERMRLSPAMRWMVENSLLRTLRRRLIPRALRDRVKASVQMRERPRLSDRSIDQLTRLFDDDLGRLGALMGVHLDCATFNDLTSREWLTWHHQR